MNFQLRAAVLAVSMLAIVGSASAESVSCVLGNNKVLVLGDLASSPTYSYGSAAKTELRLPADSAHSDVYKGTEVFSGGGAQYIAFTNGVYTYVVYDGFGRGWEFSGLRVYQNADIVFEQECKHQGVLQYDYSTVNAPEGELPY